MYILGIGDAISDAFRTLLLTLCNIVYSLIVFFFTIFEEMGTARLDINVDIIFQRIGLILGIFMVFRLTFSAITYLIDPDKMTDNQKGIGNIIKKVLIVIILLGTTQYLFKKAYELQDKLIKSQIIEKILLPGFSTNEIEENNGANIAWYVFSQFYTYNESAGGSKCSNAIKLTEDGFKYSEEPTLKGAYGCLNERERGIFDFTKEDEEDYYINFNGILALLVGVVLVWIIITYTFQVGVRVIQLAYLEIIAPIPIMMYLMPSGEDKLKKWGQQCLTTFLDFFIRLAIMNFAILIIMSLISSNNSAFLEQFSATSIIQKGYIIVVMIVATLIFAKKAPDLLKEIFPSMGGAAGFSFGIGMPKEAKGLATFGLGAGIGAVAGAATGIKYGAGTKGGRIGGALTGLVRGGLGGAKTKGNIFKNVSGGMANQRSAMQRAYDRNNDGSTFWERTIGAGDAARTKAAFDEELSFYDSYTKNADIVDSELSKNANVKAVMAEQQSLMSRAERGGPLPTASEIAAMDQKVKAIKQTALQQEMNKRGTDQENKTLMSAIQNAEAMRTKAVQKGYAGFEKYSNTKIDDYADSFLDSVKDVKAEVGNIKDVSGSRNKAYKEAEANAKYAKNK